MVEHEIHGENLQIWPIWEEDLRGGERGVAAAYSSVLRLVLRPGNEEVSGTSGAGWALKFGRAAPQAGALPKRTAAPQPGALPC